jgi:hypothetical protein
MTAWLSNHFLYLPVHVTSSFLSGFSNSQAASAESHFSAPPSMAQSAICSELSSILLLGCWCFLAHKPFGCCIQAIDFVFSVPRGMYLLLVNALLNMEESTLSRKTLLAYRYWLQHPPVLS